MSSIPSISLVSSLNPSSYLSGNYDSISESFETLFETNSEKNHSFSVSKTRQTVTFNTSFVAETIDQVSTLGVVLIEKIADKPCVVYHNQGFANMTGNIRTEATGQEYSSYGLDTSSPLFLAFQSNSLAVQVFETFMQKQVVREGRDPAFIMISVDVYFFPFLLPNSPHVRFLLLHIERKSSERIGDVSIPNKTSSSSSSQSSLHYSTLR